MSRTPLTPPPPKNMQEQVNFLGFRMESQNYVVLSLFQLSWSISPRKVFVLLKLSRRFFPSEICSDWSPNCMRRDYGSPTTEQPVSLGDWGILYGSNDLKRRTETPTWKWVKPERARNRLLEIHPRHYRKSNDHVIWQEKLFLSTQKEITACRLWKVARQSNEPWMTCSRWPRASRCQLMPMSREKVHRWCGSDKLEHTACTSPIGTVVACGCYCRLRIIELKEGSVRSPAPTVVSRSSKQSTLFLTSCLQ
jgi:hypothetical protein